MKRTLQTALAAVLLLGTLGCGSQASWGKAALDAWNVIGPEYQMYLTNDSALTAESKAIRAQTATQLTDVLTLAAGEGG